MRRENIFTTRRRQRESERAWEQTHSKLLKQKSDPRFLLPLFLTKEGGEGWGEEVIRAVQDVEAWRLRRFSGTLQNHVEAG
jgi:hypothetical protein